MEKPADAVLERTVTNEKEEGEWIRLRHHH